MAKYAHSLWWTPSIMVSSFIGGLLLAFGHHLFYSSLRHKSTSIQYKFIGSQFSEQQMNIAIGTAFAFLAKAAFVLSVSTAYYQIFWEHVKRDINSNRSPTLGRLDIAYSMLNNLISLFTVPVWYRHPLLLLIAATAWLLPVASILTPATLSVALKDDITQKSMENVPRINFSSFNFLANMRFSSFMNVGGGPPGGTMQYSYYGPSLELERIAMNVLSQKTIQSIVPSFDKPNSTWTIEFHGPSLKCGPIDSDKSLSIQRNYAEYLGENGNCYEAATFLAWYERIYTPTKGPAHYIEPYYALAGSDLYFEPEAVFSTQRQIGTEFVERNATIYFAIIPEIILDKRRHFCSLDEPKSEASPEHPLGVTGKNMTMFQCQLHNSTYHTTFEYVNNEQHVDAKVTDQGRPVQIVLTVMGPTSRANFTDGCTTFNKNPDRQASACQYDSSLLPQLAYQSVMQAFTNFITGNVTLDPSSGLIHSTRIRNTGLFDTKELVYLSDFERLVRLKEGEDPSDRAPGLQSVLASSSLVEPTLLNESLADAIEIMFRNFTMSLMSTPRFQANYSSTSAPSKVEVTQFLTQTVYVYRADRLWAAYGTAAFCTFVTMIIGLVVTFTGGASYGNSLSTTFRFARTAELSVDIKQEDYDGKSPLPGYLKDATIRPGAEYIELARQEITTAKDGGSARARLIE